MEITGDGGVQDVRTMVTVARKVSVDVQCFYCKTFSYRQTSQSLSVWVGWPAIPGDVLRIEVACYDGGSGGTGSENAVNFIFKQNSLWAVIATHRPAEVSARSKAAANSVGVSKGDSASHRTAYSCHFFVFVINVF